MFGSYKICLQLSVLPQFYVNTYLVFLHAGNKFKHILGCDQSYQQIFTYLWVWDMHLVCCKCTYFSCFHQISVGLLQDVQTISGTHPFSNAYQGSFPKVKQPGHKVDYSPPFCTKGKSKQYYAFMDWEGATLPCLVLQAFTVGVQCFRSASRKIGLYHILIPKAQY